MSYEYSMYISHIHVWLCYKTCVSTCRNPLENVAYEVVLAFLVYIYILYIYIYIVYIYIYICQIIMMLVPLSY